MTDREARGLLQQYRDQQAKAKRQAKIKEAKLAEEKAKAAEAEAKAAVEAAETKSEKRAAE